MRKTTTHLAFSVLKWFEKVRSRSEPPRTISDHIHPCSGWFNHTEPPRTFTNPLQYRESKVCRGLSHAFEVVRLYRTFSNHIFTRRSRCVWYLYTCSGWFIRSELPQTISNHFNAEKTMCVEVYHMSSGWFDYTEPFRTTSSQGDKGVYAVEPPGTST